MAERELSDDEVKALGLDAPAKERPLTDDEVASLGLDKPQRVASPTGWRDASESDGWKGLAPPARDWERQDEKKMEAMWGALASGAHGAARAMEGPINGAIAAVTTPPLSEKGAAGWDDILKRYRDEKARIEGAQKENLKRFPNAPIVGAILGTPGAAPTTAGRLVQGGIEGGTYALGSSKGDLTKGEVGKVAKDVGIGTGLGVGAAVLGEAAQKPARWLAGKAQKLSDATHAAELAAEEKARAAAVASARGAYGGEVSSGQRILEMVERASADPKADVELTAAAKQFLDSPEGEALLNQVLRSNIGRSGDAVARIQNARNAMTEAITANNPEAIANAASSAAEGKLANLDGVTGRLAELARRNVPPMVGGAIGGPAGAAAGGVVGGAMGKPGTIVSNMLKSPSMFRPMLGGVGLGLAAGHAGARGLTPPLISKAADPLSEYIKELSERSNWEDFLKEPKK